MSPEKYIELLSNLHKLIILEIKQALKTNDIAMIYPRLVIMYEFFRLLRGEAFTEFRPHTPNEQSTFYKMEDDIARRLDKVKNKIDFDDERVKYYIQKAHKWFLKP
jgi:hypothetical protein